MAFLLTLANLNDYLTRIQEPILGYDVRLFDFWKDLYATGCRPQELVQRNLWSEVDATYMQLQPVKGNDPRLILRSVLSDSFWFYWDLPDQLYAPFTLRKFRYQFRRYWQLGITTAGNKYIELYLFRHRYIKQLSANGYTVAQIMDDTGITTESIVEGYIDSEIYSQFEPESAICAEYQAVLDYATAQSYTLPSSGQQILQNTLMVDLVASGAFALLDFFHVPANDGSENFGKINWINPGSFDLTNPNACTWAADSGYSSTGSPDYLDSNFTPSSQGINFVQDSASFGLYALVKSTAVGYHGATGSSIATILQVPPGAGTNYIGRYFNNNH